MPVARFPSVAPPTVSIFASYPGEDADGRWRDAGEAGDRHLRDGDDAQQDNRDGDVIPSGLRAGETVIVEGQDRVQPGTPVKQRPWRGGSAAWHQDSWRRC
jgi:hypothetical protein